MGRAMQPVKVLLQEGRSPRFYSRRAVICNQLMHLFQTNSPLNHSCQCYFSLLAFLPPQEWPCQRFACWATDICLWPLRPANRQRSMLQQ